MCKVITVATQKGGVGKTTTTCAIATVLRHRGFRVLAVDMDPQGNLSFAVNAETEKSATIYDVLKGDLKASFAVQHRTNVSVIPTNVLLSSIEVEFTGTGREFLLQEALETLKDDYDYILIDSPPGLGVLTVNSIIAADYIIFPMLADVFSLQGINQVYETVAHIRNNCNTSLKIAGILFNKFNPRTKLAQEVYQTALMISEQLNIPVFNTRIRNCLPLSESQSIQRDLVEYAPHSTGVADFNMLVDELIEGGI